MAGSNIYNVYNSIYNTLKKKGYNLQVEKPIHISFSKIISGAGSFGWDYPLKKNSFLNKGIINIREEDVHIFLYASISSRSLFFYYSLLTLITLVFSLRLDFDFLYVSIFLILIFGGLFTVFYLTAKRFIHTLIDVTKN